MVMALILPTGFQCLHCSPSFSSWSAWFGALIVESRKLVIVWAVTCVCLIYAHLYPLVCVQESCPSSRLEAEVWGGSSPARGHAVGSGAELRLGHAVLVGHVATGQAAIQEGNSHPVGLPYACPSSMCRPLYFHRLAFLVGGAGMPRSLHFPLLSKGTWRVLLVRWSFPGWLLLTFRRLASGATALW